MAVEKLPFFLSVPIYLWIVEKHGIILFDGVCNLCNASVQYIIRKDQKGYFKFSTLQSERAQTILQQHGLSVAKMNSIVLIENNKVYQQSTAVLRIARKLKGPIKLAYAFIIIPPFIRNFVYGFIARRRYRWFGKKEICMMPRPEWTSRFEI